VKSPHSSKTNGAPLVQTTLGLSLLFCRTDSTTRSECIDFLFGYRGAERSLAPALQHGLHWFAKPIFKLRSKRFATALAKFSAAIRGRSLDEIFGEYVRDQRRTRRVFVRWDHGLVSGDELARFAVVGELQGRQEVQMQTQAANQGFLCPLSI
jgi:hypothetical protein